MNLFSFYLILFILGRDNYQLLKSGATPLLLNWFSFSQITIFPQIERAFQTMNI